MPPDFFLSFLPLRIHRAAVFSRGRPVSRIFYCFFYSRKINFSGVELYYRFFRGQVDCCPDDTRQFIKPLFHPGGAGSAAHAGNFQLNFFQHWLVAGFRDLVQDHLRRDFFRQVFHGGGLNSKVNTGGLDTGHFGQSFFNTTRAGGTAHAFYFYSHFFQIRRPYRILFNSWQNITPHSGTRGRFSCAEIM
ncbi:MAG: hypothetical protein BWY65_01247 [Firmicutes bacterium ADurb.Bin373]|nr:MAG: hypothetical protein BWY65_01247 [Firmicutes bacterium ADurb.Bin373]